MYISSSSMYLVLPANASPVEFPENSNSAYKVRLPNRLRLDGSKWECALLELFYPNNWHNVTDGKMTVRIYDKDKTEEKGEDVFREIIVEIRTGRYKSMQDLLDEIHETQVSYDIHRAFDLRWDEVRDLMFLKFDGDIRYAVRFSSDLADILGFDDKIFYSVDPENDRVRGYEADRRPDLHQGFTSLYVYCSLCDNRTVGHQSVPLLRTLPVRNNDAPDRNVYEEVRNAHYVPITNTDTDVIEINISRDDGRLVAFKGGKVIVTVHLRRAI